MNHITRQIKDIASLSSRFNQGVLSVRSYIITCDFAMSIKFMVPPHINIQLSIVHWLHQHPTQYSPLATSTSNSVVHWLHQHPTQQSIGYITLTCQFQNGFVFFYVERVSRTRVNFVQFYACVSNFLHNQQYVYLHLIKRSG